MKNCLNKKRWQCCHAEGGDASEKNLAYICWKILIIVILFVLVIHEIIFKMCR